ncbi:PEP-CTERM sorting domain-containing protein [uncultured Desulfobacter sp.]|uniref:PEP-CTERM sorting domain-containing protein n=1 Tax=uncultured Desulfobacter sp. TaxID=240139 RepID=UPI0029F4A2D8|nr:PEP-CTERM sorting domain-containing protein [uncultured Desulfobacter sp.]
MKKFFLATLVLLCSCTTLYAEVITFFGEDLGIGEGTALTSWDNASAAQTDFYSNLTGITTEDFEDMTGSEATFGSITATLSNGELKTVTSGTNGYGRYPISGDNYWEVSESFTLTFSEAISAFGFYGVDIGDFNGQVVLSMESGTTVTLNIENSINVSGGGVLYFGFYDLENSYTSISFTNTAASTDTFAFDDFTIGTIENVDPIGNPNNAVPEPATILLLGFGLIGIAGVSRHKKTIN